MQEWKPMESSMASGPYNVEASMEILKCTERMLAGKSSCLNLKAQ